MHARRAHRRKARAHELHAADLPEPTTPAAQLGPRLDLNLRATLLAQEGVKEARTTREEAPTSLIRGAGEGRKKHFVYKWHR
eukprot:scaffold101032_cov28-Tisochrysis_lutea.AAC.5